MWYGQADFGAAVALACGRGYVNPPEDIPTLARFLALQSDRFSCADLPAALQPRALGLTQRLYRYLLWSVAAVWAIRGVSLSALWPLFGLMYGATAAVWYGLLRVAMSRRAALVVAALLMLSPIQLGNLPGLRDFAKAPFILGLILIAATLVRRIQNPRAALRFSVLFGCALGIGFGFRNDLLIVAPLVAVALFVWDPPRDYATLRVRAVALALAGLAFFAAALPIVSGYTRGSNTGHVAVLGLMTPFDEPLGVTPSVYAWGNVYSDGFIDAIVRSYSYRVHNRAVEYLSPEYDRMAVEYMLQTARHWPADVITRAYASVLRIADMPFNPGVHADRIPYGLTGTAARRFYLSYDAAAGLLTGAGIAAVAAALLIVSATSMWQALLLLAGLMYFAGYPAIQFQPRHYFHLEVIPWLALGFVAERILKGAVAAMEWRRAIAFAAVSAALVAVPFLAARVYQQRHLRGMIQRYVEADRDAVSVTDGSSGGRTELRLASLWDAEDPDRAVNAQLLIARFSPDACPVVRLPVTFRYAVEHAEPDFSLDTVIAFVPRSPVDVFVPAYDVAGKSRFRAIEVARGFERCVEQVERVRHPEAFPILVALQLTPGWEHQPLYQRLTNWERPSAPPNPALYALPPTLTLPVSTLYAAPMRPPLLWQTPMVHDTSQRVWAISGTPQTPIWPLFEFAPERHTPKDRFVVEGDVRRGGITVGLVRNHQWTINGHVTIDKPGHFVAVMAPVDDGEYGALCENGLRDSWFLEYAPRPIVGLAGRFRDFNDVRITRIGWVQ